MASEASTKCAWIATRRNELLATAATNEDGLVLGVGNESQTLGFVRDSQIYKSLVIEVDYCQSFKANISIH